MTFLFLNAVPAILLLSGEGLNPAGWPKFVNLLLFVGLLYYLLRKPSREFFAKRLADVRSILDRAAKDKDEATTKLNSINDRMNRIESEIAEIKAQSGREADAERQRISKDTEREVEHLKQLAKREIDVATLGAKVELRKYAAERAVDLAEQIIRKELTPEGHKQLVDRATAGLKDVR